MQKVAAAAEAPHTSFSFVLAFCSFVGLSAFVAFGVVTHMRTQRERRSIRDFESALPLYDIDDEDEESRGFLEDYDHDRALE